MGTVASIDFSGGELNGAALRTVEAVERVFSDYDRVFSLYRSDSQLSRIATGALALGDAGARVLDAYGEALHWRDATNGAFTPHRPDGVIDLDGIVKAYAIRDAGAVLDAAEAAAGVTGAGSGRWCLNVGGDVIVRGSGWRVGIVDPVDRSALLLSVSVGGASVGTSSVGGDRRAVATSGDAERGEHIWRGGSRELPEFRQVTVIAHGIVTADVLATSIIAGGRASLDEAVESWPVDVLAVSRSGELVATPGFRAAIAG